ncbi:MAG: hypothetical protein ABFC65_01925 [Rectinema sp.]
MKLLVFAAGIGSRFGGVKQLIGVGPYDETLLEYSLFDALHAGFDHFVFLIRPEMEEDFRTGILARLPASLSYSLAYQTLDSLLDEASHARLGACGRTKPWGTGHALLCAREQLESTGPFAVINADDYYGPLGFKKVGVRLCSNPEEFCFPGYRLDDVVPPCGSVSRAICSIDGQEYLETIVEHKSVWREDGRILSSLGGQIVELSPEAIVSMNLWGFNASIFGYADHLWKHFLSDAAGFETEEFFLPEIVESMVRQKAVRVKMLPASVQSFGLTNPDDLTQTRRRISNLVLQGVYPSPLWGNTIA